MTDEIEATTEQKVTRERRSDRGEIRQTARDAQAIEWLSQMYGAPLDVVQKLLGTTLAATREVVSRWKSKGARWVETGKVDAGPLWVWPTRSTAAAYLGWDPGYWVAKPSTTAHLRASAEARWALTGADTERWISERVLLHQAPKKERGTKQPHIHDGLYRLDNGEWIAVEVELTAKQPSVMKDVLYDAMHEASQRDCAGVLYLVRGVGVRNAVQTAAAAIARSHRKATLDDLKIYELDKLINDGRLIL